jgi:hypothetical protein
MTIRRTAGLISARCWKPHAYPMKQRQMFLSDHVIANPFYDDIPLPELSKTQGYFLHSPFAFCNKMGCPFIQFHVPPMRLQMWSWKGPLSWSSLLIQAGFRLHRLPMGPGEHLPSLYSIRLLILQTSILKMEAEYSAETLVSTRLSSSGVGNQNTKVFLDFMLISCCFLCLIIGINAKKL